MLKSDAKIDMTVVLNQEVEYKEGCFLDKGSLATIIDEASKYGGVEILFEMDGEEQLAIVPYDCVDVYHDQGVVIKQLSKSEKIIKDMYLEALISYINAIPVEVQGIQINESDSYKLLGYLMKISNIEIRYSDDEIKNKIKRLGIRDTDGKKFSRIRGIL